MIKFATPSGLLNCIGLKSSLARVNVLFTEDKGFRIVDTFVHNPENEHDPGFFLPRAIAWNFRPPQAQSENCLADEKG